MDAALAALLPVVPQLGVGGLIFAVLLLALRWHGQDRTDYRAQLTQLTERHAAELARINAAHDAELAELKADIKELRQRLDEVNADLDRERERRRIAEDSAMQQLNRRDHRPESPQ